MSLPETHKVVRLYPPSHDIRVEIVPTPKIEHADDAIVRIIIAGLCGSDLHAYRGHDKFANSFVCGHEFAGEVVALGESYSETAAALGRPPLYATLKVGDKVVAPFTSSCSECHFCRMGFTGRCEKCLLFGSQRLSGGQAQYVRVPLAGGTLFKIPPDNVKTEEDITQWKHISNASLVLMADILPTGLFAATQLLQHPNILPALKSKPFPVSLYEGNQKAAVGANIIPLTDVDKQLTLAVIGLGPVGLCAIVSLLEQLESNKSQSTRIVAIDLLESRRTKAAEIVKKIGGVPGNGLFKTATIDEGKKIVAEWTGGLGVNAAIEIVGHNDALELAFELIRPFGVITSVGVHQNHQVPLIGKGLYDKNVSLVFGRCPVRTMFPFALELLLKRQDIFGDVGQETSLIDRVVSIDEAAESYVMFDKGLCGKVLFDPWK
ncbi:hypothetical protein Clacol_009098 [Clathrus columnatus]|uniref:Alcohol dehydrogenase n=1 Tax=Clathrus columnatus TaxID=1419009 RepID=A0AAV5ASG2_9AGAM|nr:hypothetical protein Clacol_009098 [Clathrus columnatus]